MREASGQPLGQPLWTDTDTPQPSKLESHLPPRLGAYALLLFVVTAWGGSFVAVQTVVGGLVILGSLYLTQTS